MSDLMREEFDAWQSKETPGADLEHCGELIGNGPARVSYRNMYVAERWIGWQASRECLVIDLPPEPEYPEDPEEAIDDSHMDSYHSAIRMRNACRDSIHAAGVKTK